MFMTVLLHKNVLHTKFPIALRLICVHTPGFVCKLVCKLRNKTLHNLKSAITITVLFFDVKNA